MLMSGYYGPEIWTYQISGVVGHEWLFQDYSVRDVLIPVILGSFLLAHLPFWYLPPFSCYALITH